MKRVCFIVIVIAILILAGCGEESKAKGTAEDYMDAEKNGEEFEDIAAGNGFIDVFDYEYLDTVEESETEDTVELTKDLWESVHKSEYDSFEEYKDAELEMRSNYEVLQNNSDVLELWDGESYKKSYILLYDVEIANDLGEKIYKKAEITVEEGITEDDEEGFLITNITLR